MKKPSSDLFELVQLLTKSEKRYLKVQATGQDKKHIQLLDVLLKQKKYDEVALKKEHRRARFCKHFAVSKQYLYDYVLKHLIQLDQKDKIAQIKQGISYLELLYNKGLFSQSYKQLLKWKQQAYDFELYEEILQMLKTEKLLLSSSFEQKLKMKAARLIFEEEQTCLEKLANINNYWWLNNEIYELQKRFQKIDPSDQMAQIQEIQDNEELKDIQKATSLRSKMYFFQANATFQFTIGYPEKAYAYNEQFLALLESNEAFLKRFPTSYLGTLNNLLIDSLVLKKKKALEEGIKKLRALPQQEAFKKVKDIEANVFRQGYMLEINYCLSEGDFERAATLLPALEQGLKQYKKQIRRHNQISFYYLAAYILFRNKEFATSLNWLNLILNDKKEDVVKEIFQFSRVLNLLVHFELQNFELLSSLIPSTRRYLRTRRSIYEVEKLLFRFLQKAITVVQPKDVQVLSVQFKNEILQNNLKRKEARVFNYVDLLAWLEEGLIS